MIGLGIESMTADEHERAALHLLERAGQLSKPDNRDHLVACAQVHATLAVARASGLQHIDFSLGAPKITDVEAERIRQQFTAGR